MNPIEQIFELLKQDRNKIMHYEVQLPTGTAYIYAEILKSKKLVVEVEVDGAYFCVFRHPEGKVFYIQQHRDKHSEYDHLPIRFRQFIEEHLEKCKACFNN